METFLQDCLQSLVNLTNYDLIHLVVGNESCDLDSAVSALVYAYLLKITKYAASEKSIVIPVLNVVKEEYQLKTELGFWLQEIANLNRNLFIFKDDLTIHLRNKEATVLVTLVDHNEDAEFEKMGKLVEIVDHHQLSNVDRSNVQLDVDAKAGSCCTLVARKYLDYCESRQTEPDVHIVLLLYGPIVLDTACFSQTAQRYSAKDEEIVQRLEAVLGPNLTREDAYQQLFRARMSLSNFSVEQLLLKDLKVLEGGNRRLALASITGNLAQKLFQEETFPQPLIDFCLKYKYIGLIVLSIDNTDPKEIRRDLALYTANVDLFNEICSTLEDSSSNLSLSLLWKKSNARLWSQGNVNASRKLILPLAAQLINRNSNSGTQEKADNERTVPNDIPLIKHPKEPLLRQISTADVDPEFLFNYKAETVDFPESPIAHISIEKSGNTESPVTARKGKKASLTAPQPQVNETVGSLGSQNSPKYVLNRRQNSTTSSNQPLESINYYESYFMDSYIGDFTGEIDVEKVNGDETLSQWCSGTNLNEFNPELSFDSFGPESLLYSSHLDNTQETTASRSNNDNNNQTSQPNLPDCDLQSLSVAEPQLVDKVKQCFDESKIKTGYELTAEEAPSGVLEEKQEEKEKEDSHHLSARNGPLTQSMRRKISPKLKFDEILNTSDDVGMPDELLTVPSPIINDVNDIHISIQESNGTSVKADVEPATPSHNFEATHVRQNSTSTKKKITVNRDFLDSDELSGETPEGERRKVTFFGSGDGDGEAAEKIPELTVREELEESRNWRPSCPIGLRGEVKRIDMKVIEPYKKVLSHGGYYHHYNTVQLRKNNQVSAPSPAVIIFSACYLPDRSRRDYEYVMDNLFMYVLTTLHELVADDYILIYFHNAGGSGISGNNMPTFSWLKRCYYMIDRKLRKNLKSLFLVHPTFWLKTLVIMTKPFVSSKFSRKLQFVNTLAELNDLVPIESTIIPPPVKQHDEFISSM